MGSVFKIYNSQWSTVIHILNLQEPWSMTLSNDYATVLKIMNIRVVAGGSQPETLNLGFVLFENLTLLIIINLKFIYLAIENSTLHT